MPNELQSLTFSAVPESLYLAFRKSGGTLLSGSFRAGDALSTLEAQLVTLYGAGVSVSGSLVASGSAPNRTYSGSLTASFGGALASQDVPLIEVFSGEVRRRRVVSGNSASYSFDGGQGFALPISQSAFNANQTAIDAAHAASISVGQSAGVGSGITVSGAGTLGYNGFYTQLNPQTYRLDASHFLTYPGGSRNYWVLASDITDLASDSVSSDAKISYAATNGNISTLPTAFAVYGSGGASPAPTAGPFTAGDFSLDFSTYFPVGVSLGPLSSSGSGSSNSLVQTQSFCSLVTAQAIREGQPMLDTQLSYNYKTASGTSPIFDLGGQTSNGWTGVLHIADSADETAALGVVIKASTTGAFAGEETTLASFPAASIRGASILRSQSRTSVLPRFVRAFYAITGGTAPGFAFNVSLCSFRVGGAL